MFVGALERQSRPIMVDPISYEVDFAKWLQKARIEVTRVAIYFVLVGGVLFVGWLLCEALTPLISIIGFAAAVFIVAAILPIINRQLHGVLVDTIYYSAAIGATLIIFVANGNDRLANQISREIVEKEQSLASVRLRQSQMATAQELYEGQLVRMRAELIDANAALNRPEAVELSKIEAELSTNMINDLGLDRLIEFLPQRLSRCDGSRENLSSLNAQAFQLERERYIPSGTSLGAAARGREINARDAMMQGMIQAAVEDAGICDRFQRPAEYLLSAPDSYARLLGLMTITDLIDPPWFGFDDDPQQRDLLTHIEEFEETRQKRDLLTGSLDSLEISIPDGRTALLTANAEINAGEMELEILGKELATSKTAHLAGSIARAKDWGDRIWPYLLVTLLGMKLARKPMLALR